MTFVSKIFKWTWNCVSDRIYVSLCSEFVNLYATRQHLGKVKVRGFI